MSGCAAPETDYLPFRVPPLPTPRLDEHPVEPLPRVFNGFFFIPVSMVSCVTRLGGSYRRWIASCSSPTAGFPAPCAPRCRQHDGEDDAPLRNTSGPGVSRNSVARRRSRPAQAYRAAVRPPPPPGWLRTGCAPAGEDAQQASQSQRRERVAPVVCRPRMAAGIGRFTRSPARAPALGRPTRCCYAGWL